MKQELFTTLSTISKRVVDAFTEILNANPRLHTFEINCKELNDSFHDNDIRASNEFKTLFDKVFEIKNPVVYWFVIKSKISSDEIIDCIRHYKQVAGINARATPAFKAFPHLNSNILYVGKVKSGFWGRLITI